MRIIALSDTHGDTDAIDSLFARCGHPDLIIHCGDMERDCDYIELTKPEGVPFLAVGGNNDWHSDRLFHIIETIGKFRFYITHGHQERVKSDPRGLLRAARANNCQVVLHGHTHRAVDFEEEGIRIINPGALSGKDPTYAEIIVQKDALSVQIVSLYETI